MIKKKILALLLAMLALCMMLVSCGEDDENTAPSTVTTETGKGGVDWSGSDKTVFEVDFEDLL